MWNTPFTKATVETYCEENGIFILGLLKIAATQLWMGSSKRSIMGQVTYFKIRAFQERLFTDIRVTSGILTYKAVKS